MLSIRIAKEKDKSQGHWLSLPADSEERLKVLRKLDEGEPIGTTVAICITGVKSSVPNLKQYIHEHDSLESLSILAARIDKMSDRDAAMRIRARMFCKPQPTFTRGLNISIPSQAVTDVSAGRS